MRLQDRLHLLSGDLTSVVHGIESICKCLLALETQESLTSFTRLSMLVDFGGFTKGAIHLS